MPGLLRLWTVLTLAVAAILPATPTQVNRVLAYVPIETAFGGIPFFQASVNSIGPLQFLLNTGNAGSSVAEDVADQLGVKPQSRGSAAAGNPTIDARVVPGATITVGSASYAAEKIVTAPLRMLEPVFGRRIDGILGGDWIQQYVVELDLEAGRMRLYDPKEFKYRGRGQSLPLAVIRGIPFVDLKVTLPNTKSLWGHFLVDSAGGGMAVHIDSSIVARGGLADGLKVIEVSGQGTGAMPVSFALRGADVEIGKVNLKNPVVVIARDEAGMKIDPTSSGLVGMDVLRRFKITFDYSRQRMYLEPNRRLHEPFLYDTTGMALRAAGPNFTDLTVSSVKDPSPAKSAGLQAGDQLLQIDERELAGMTLEAVRIILRPAGQTHRLKIMRAGQAMEMVLHTREILP